MAKGRKRKLAAVAALEGDTTHRIIEASGIEGLGEPFVPEHLVDDARGVIECIKASMPPKVYCALDTYMLAAFGMAWAIHKRAALEISNPNFQAIGKGQRVSPWLRILNEQAAMIASLGAKLGLDPLSRQAMKLPRMRQDQSKFSGLIGARDELNGSSNTLNA